MKLKKSVLVWMLIWCLFMGVTAISIGFGALFPSMNLISKPFVCPRGEMSVEKQVYNPYPGTTITTLTWYCIDPQNGAKTEIGILPMSISAGLIYGFILFILVLIGMWIYAKRFASNEPEAGYGAINPSALRGREPEGFRDIPGFGHDPLGESRKKGRTSETALARMKELKDLRAANMISESEYESKRAEILKDL